MNTQTKQLSLLETEHVSGGFGHFKAPLMPNFPPPEFKIRPVPPIVYITQSTREDGGKFDIA